MPQVQTTESGTHRTYAKSAGDEPLPGYRLLAPLGRGGFGEVWKCEAPGGLQKAVKFVASESEDGRGEQRLGQELAAFEQIKAIRHPFLLTLERVELVGGELVMVMELADRQLHDRFAECRTAGLPGIPRDELLGYFADAAEALDVIGVKFGLQHLDVKPANIFIVSGHAKVGDYGLVARFEGPDAGHRGLTPRYVSPEMLHGSPSGRSDQYSLALVYHELLTGDFPYPGRTPQQLMLQHVSGVPNIGALPECDRPAVAKALAKRPDERFASCLEFVQALMSAGAGAAPAMIFRQARVSRSVAEIDLGAPAPPPPSPPPTRHGDSTHAASPLRSRDSTQNVTLPGRPHLTVPGAPRRSGPQARVATPPPAGADTPPPLGEEPAEAGMVVLERIRSVVPIAELLGKTAPAPRVEAHAFAAAVLQAATAGRAAPAPDGALVSRFPSTVPASVVPLKLAVLCETWGVALEQPEPSRVVLRRTLGGGGFFGGKKHGLEVVVELPNGGRPVGEITATGRTFGPTDAKAARQADELLPKILADVRAQVGNAPENRERPRIPCELPVALYPLHSDGAVDLPIPATCRDASLDGLALHPTRSLKTKYAYAAFAGVAAVEGLAILVRVVGVEGASGARRYGVQFRTDL
jgi:serine/threonine protein kinase